MQFIIRRKCQLCKFYDQFDGSDIAKRRLAYEGELIYLHTTPGSVPQVRPRSFISMKPYIADTAKLFHITLRFMPSVLNSMISWKLKSGICTHKLIGADADGTSVNIRGTNVLVINGKTVNGHVIFIVLNIKQTVDFLNDTFSDTKTFSTKFYLYLRNSSREWCNVFKIGEINNI